MWDAVRRELITLEWGAGPEGTQPGLLADWAATVPALLAARQALGRLHDPADPFTTLTTLTRGARNAGGEPLPAPTLGPLRAALGEVAASVDRTPVVDRAPRLAALTQAAWVLAHWARARVPLDHPAHAWLLTAETVLDGAVNAPAPRTPLARSMAGWQNALAEVQGRPEPLFRRGATVGHLRILKSAHAGIDYATRRGMLPAAFGQSLLDAVGQLSLAHQRTLQAPQEPRAEPSTADQLLMIRLGRSVEDLTRPQAAPDDLAGRLDALLRTTLGHAPLVAALGGQPAAQRAADRLQRLTLEYLNHPQLLNPAGADRATPARPPTPPPTPPPTSQPAPPRPAPAEPVQATIPKGTVLDPQAVLALCRARDLGLAAATADPARPPEVLRGTDPATWPQLAQAGRQAVADLVASVTPMVYAQTRHGPNLDDLRGELFVTLLKAAHLFDPTRSGGGAWPTYAWRTLDHRRWGQFDFAGVPRGRTAPTTFPLGDTEVAHRTPGPDDLAVQGHAPAVDTIAAAVAALPGYLRGPLEASMTGQPTRFIAEDLHISASTAHRRIKAARDILREQLADPRDPDAPAARHGAGGSREARSDARPAAGDPDARTRWVTSTPLPGDQDAPAHPGAPVDRTPPR